MKRIILIVLALCIFCSYALAADEYVIEAMKAPKDALLNIAFGEQSNMAKQVKGRVDTFFEIPNDSISRYCKYEIWKLAPKQLHIGVNISQGDKDIYLTYANVESGGKTRDNYSRDEAIEKAKEIFRDLGLSNPKLWYAIAYGNLSFCKPFYSILLGQTIDNAPMYWAASYFKNDENGNNSKWNISSNAVEVHICKEGILSVWGAISQVTALNKNLKVMQEQEAKIIFEQTGLKVDNIEFCYLIQEQNKKTIAKPSYRYQNYFIHAATGERLQ